MRQAWTGGGEVRILVESLVVKDIRLPAANAGLSLVERHGLGCVRQATRLGRKNFGFSRIKGQFGGYRKYDVMRIWQGDFVDSLDF